MPKPYISFVMAARNDDFGGNFLSRLQACINSILTFSKKHDLSAELIIVEWNPPKGRPRLKDAVIWPKDAKPVKIKIIGVSNEIHNRFKNSEKIPFFEFFAKNAGIRRSKGEYVLATNSDIIFSEEMLKYFASRPFSDNIFCRADRYDIKIIKGSSFFEQPLDEQIQFCRKNIFQIQTMHGAIIQSNSEWFKTRVLERLKRLNIKKISDKFKNFTQKTISPTEKKGGERFRGLYINAGGDFMLLSKKQWDYFRGYPALGIDRGLDCYMTIMAHIAGLLQVIIPYPIYHIEHDRSSQYLRPTAVLEKIPAFEKMVETNKHIITNDENWGLRNEKLEEFVME